VHHGLESPAMARRRKPIDDDLDDEEIVASPRRLRRPRKRWRVAFVLVALIVLTITAPSIIAKTQLRNALLSSALPPGAGKLTAVDAVFSWTSGQGLASVAHIDANGAPVFTAEKVTVSRSLIGFASNQNDLGKVVLTRPVVHLDTRDGGSNLEDVLQAIATAAAARPQQAPLNDSNSASKTVEVEIIDGVLLGRDAATGQHWRIDALALTAKPLPELNAWDVTATGVMTVSVAAGQSAAADRAAPTDVAFVTTQPGRFKLHIHPAVANAGAISNPSGGGDAPARHQLAIVADRLPLAPLEPWLARVLPRARLTGDASADLKLTWAPPEAAPLSNPSALRPQASSLKPLLLTANGNLSATNIRFTAAALSGDLLELPTATIALDAALAGDRLSARNCTARTDWLEAELNGDFDLQEIANLTLKSLPTSDATVTARADLPQLTRMLPRTLRLRPGVRIDAGSMEITALSAAENGARRWTVAAVVQDLLGSDGVRPIRWTAPVEGVAELAQGPSGPQLQKALLRSTFATATADGTAGGLEGQLKFNLEELGSQLGQFVDLSAWRLRGTGEGQFSWRDTGDSRFAASAELDLKQIDVQRDGKVVWQDPEVRVEAQANGNREGLSPKRFDVATVTVRGPGDTLTAELLEPIDLTDLNHAWSIRLTGNGPLERWAGRVRPWVAGVPEQLAGQATLAAQLRARTGFVHVTQSDLDVTDFRAQVGATTIIEPRMKSTGDFRWDSQTRAIESNDLQITSSTVAARASGVSVQFGETGPPTARGRIAFRGDFERVSAWGNLLGATQDGLRPRGAFEGLLQLTSDASRATSTLTFKAEPFQLVNAADGAVAWNEPRIDLATEAVYTNADDRLQFSNVRLTGKTVQMQGAGVVEQFRTAGLVRGDVNVSYDAAELATLLATYLGPNVHFQGANTARLQATGKLYTGVSTSVSDSPAPSPWRGGLGMGEVAPISTTSETTWNADSAASPQPSRLTPHASSLAAHWSQRWQVATETGWAAANLYGLPVGAARLTANVREGQIQFTPLELTVGQGGRVSLQPRVTLDPAPQVLELAPGQMISNVAISAEVSERMLKYAAPIVAGATRTEGSFSFFMEGAQIPLRQPKQGRLNGRLTIHNLAVMPGPMLQSIAGLIRQIEGFGKTAQGGSGNPLEGLLGGLQPQQPAQAVKGITMTERAIDIQVADGRVYHRNLEFLIDDVPVRSQGSVGFDESLALEIEVPIQAKWVGNKPALQGLIGQTIRIPVTGTFAKPNIDERAIGAFLTQAAQAAAGGLLGDELNKALDKLLRPR
jgi:translocation and assembly module TamB